MKNLKAACLVLLLVGCTSNLDKQVPGSDVADGGIDIEVTDGSDGSSVGDLVQKDDVADVASDIPDIYVFDVPDSSDKIAPTDVIEVLGDTEDTSEPDVCVPDCEAKQCGDDGCGGSCGECPCGGCSLAATSCEDGQCRPGCNDCDCHCMWLCPLECPGEVDDICLDSCGITDQGLDYGIPYPIELCLDEEGYYECAEDEQDCLDAAFDICVDKVCSCNSGDKSCKEMYECMTGCGDDYDCLSSCIYTSTDEAIDTWDIFIGCLDLAGYFDCAEVDVECLNGSWDSCNQEYWACVGCTPDCSSKECGDDGCGGSCGECENSLGCLKGNCIEMGGECTDGNGINWDGCTNGYKSEKLFDLANNLSGAVSTEDGYRLFWTDKLQPFSTEHVLVFKDISVDGTFEPNATLAFQFSEIPEEYSATFWDVKVLPLSDGTAVAVFLVFNSLGGSGYRFAFVHLDHNGLSASGPIIPEPWDNVIFESPFEFNAVGLGNDGFAITYAVEPYDPLPLDYWYIRMMTYDTSGALLSEGNITSGWYTSSDYCVMPHVDLAAPPDGQSLMAVWEHYNSDDPIYCKSDGQFPGDDGNEVVGSLLDGLSDVENDSPFIVNGWSLGDQIFPIIVSLGENGYVVSWSGQIGSSWEDLGISARVLSSSGSPVGDDLILFTEDTYLWDELVWLGGHDWADIAGVFDMDVVSITQLVGKVYSENDNSISEPLSVSICPDSKIKDIYATSNQDGSYLVSWVNCNCLPKDQCGIFIRLLEH